MALYLDARGTPETLFRLWDTQCKCYVYRPMHPGDALTVLVTLLREGGIADGPDVRVTVYGWFATAEKHGTNEPGAKPVAFNGPWRSGNPDNERPGVFRRMLHARLLTEQLARAVLETRVEERLSGLLPAGRAFLNDTMVLHELLRGPGVAVLRRPRADAEAAALVREVDETLAGLISVDQEDTGDPAEVVYRFRLI